MRIGSLFSGAGGLDLGLETAGLGSPAWFVERDADARAVLREHWPDVPIVVDVRHVQAGRMAPVDLVAGGFPCQDISNAGSRKGLEGDRSGLWREYARIVREIRPFLVLVENVAALRRRGLDVVLGDLAALGYDAAWDCIPALSVGAPHRRDRLFLVAWRVADPVRQGREGGAVGSERGRSDTRGNDLDVADSVRSGRHASGDLRPWESDPAGVCRFGDLVADPDRWRLSIERVARRHEERGARGNVPHGFDLPAWPYGPHDPRWRDVAAEAQPAVRGVAFGFPSRVAQLRLAGNSVAPVVGEAVGDVIASALRDAWPT